MAYTGNAPRADNHRNHTFRRISSRAASIISRQSNRQPLVPAGDAEQSELGGHAVRNEPPGPNTHSGDSQ